MACSRSAHARQCRFLLSWLLAGLISDLMKDGSARKVEEVFVHGPSTNEAEVQQNSAESSLVRPCGSTSIHLKPRGPKPGFRRKCERRKDEFHDVRLNIVSHAGLICEVLSVDGLALSPDFGGTSPICGKHGIESTGCIA